MNFSVICPTYNSSSYIEKTINCLLNQKYKNFEVIFSDDGSEDQTISILESFRIKFENLKINIVILKNNHKGPGHARNRAIEQAKNEWISFIDSDDLWAEDKLQKVANFLEKEQNYNCILHRQFFIGLNKKIKKYDFDKYFKNNVPVKKQLYLRNFFAMSAVTLKKDLINSFNGFDENYKNAQDYDLWIRIGNNFKVYILPEYLGSYCERAGNITSSPYSKRIKNVLKILIKNKKDISYIVLIIAILKVLVNKEWFKKLS